MVLDRRGRLRIGMGGGSGMAWDSLVYFGMVQYKCGWFWIGGDGSGCNFQLICTDVPQKIIAFKIISKIQIQNF